MQACTLGCAQHGQVTMKMLVVTAALAGGPTPILTREVQILLFSLHHR